MLTAVVLARNQAHNLPQCLKSLRFCNEILLIDDDSSDNTSVVARTYGAKVFRRSMNGAFSAQRNYALSLVKTGWVLFVDSDEDIFIKADCEIDEDTIPAAIQVLSENDDEIECEWSLESSDTRATCEHAQEFDDLTVYVVTVDGLMCFNGDTIESIEFSFETGVSD